MILDILVLDVPGFLEARTKSGDKVRRLAGRSAAQEPDDRHGRPHLRPGDERYGEQPAGQPADERPSIHHDASLGRKLK